MSRGEHVDHLEVDHFDIFGRNLLRLTNFSWIPGDHLLDSPCHLPAGPPGLLLLLAPHHEDFPAGEDVGSGGRVSDLGPKYELTEKFSLTLPGK